MPVGTYGTVKGMLPRDIEEIDADIILGKQRHGPTGTVKVEFEGIYTKFKDLNKN